MLVALISILVASLFGSGGSSPYLHPNVEKVIKKSIEDADRKKEALAIARGYKKEWKALKKIEKKQAKSISKMNRDPNVEAEVLAEAFQQSRGQRKDLHLQLITARVKIQNLVTDEEWDAGIDKILDIKPKAAKKLDKAEAKAQIHQNKKIAAVRKDIEAVFTDPAKKGQVEQSFLRFEDDLTNLLVESQSITYKDLEILRDRQASSEDLQAVADHLEELTARVHASYLDLRQDLISLSSEDTWPKLAKALGKFF